MYGEGYPGVSYREGRRPARYAVESSGPDGKQKEITMQEADATTLFHELTRRKRYEWVRWQYIAIQAGFAMRANHIDVPSFLDALDLPLAEKIRLGSIGATGIAVLGIVYDIRLVKEGDTDFHEYRVKRKSDGKTMLVTLKTYMSPNNPGPQDDPEDENRKIQLALERIKRSGPVPRI